MRRDADRVFPTAGPDRRGSFNGGAQQFRDTCGKCGARRIDAQIGLEASPDAYIAELVAVFRELRRVLRDDGTLWLNFGDSYAGGGTTGRNDADRDFTGGGGNKLGSGNPGGGGRFVRGGKPKDLLMMPARVALALQADGWWLRSDIIWHKLNPMPESVTDRPTSAHEHVFLLTKAPTYYFDADAVREPIKPDGNHDNLRMPKMDGYSGDRGRNGPTQAARHYDEIKGANCRSVWTIATSPYAEAHFATFPPELAERCIKAGTSERGACPYCSAPWGRVVERSTAMPARVGDWKATGAGHRNDIDRKGGFYDASATTTGWRQTCACPAANPVACVVLDPFAGAFTTALVADRLQRDAIGIELSEAYCTMARNRLLDDAGMFADVAN